MFILVPETVSALTRGRLYQLNIGEKWHIMTITNTGIQSLPVWEPHDSLYEPRLRLPIQCVETISTYLSQLSISPARIPNDLPQGIRVWSWYDYHNRSVPKATTSAAKIGSEPLSEDDYNTLCSYVGSSDFDTCLLGMDMALGSAISEPEKVLEIFMHFSQNSLWWNTEESKVSIALRAINYLESIDTASFRQFTKNLPITHS